MLTQHGRGAAVLLDIRSYQGLLDELEELLDVAQGLAEVAEDAWRHEDVAARIAARLTR